MRNKMALLDKNNNTDINSDDGKIINAFDDKYIIDHLIGSGGYSEVYLVTEIATNEKYCQKKINANKTDDISNECCILSKCDNFGIVKIHEIFIDEKIIIMEYLNGRTLKRLMVNKIHAGQKFNEEEILNIFYQLCLVVYYLQSKNIIHRDIKSSNIIVIKDDIIKLIDFGLSYFSENASEETKTVCGTIYYIAPEMYKKENYGNSSDIWSLGIILFQMIELSYPFMGYYSRPKT